LPGTLPSGGASGRGALPWTTSNPLVFEITSTSPSSKASVSAPRPARRLLIRIFGSQSGSAGSTYRRWRSGSAEAWIPVRDSQFLQTNPDRRLIAVDDRLAQIAFQVRNRFNHARIRTA